MTDSAGSESLRLIHVSAGLLVNADEELLLVRKHGTSRYMQPGGKREPGESPDETLVRELEEELGLRVETESLRPLGRFRAPAANEPGHVVVAHCYLLRLTGHEAAAVACRAELAEAIWVSLDAALGLPLAPLTEDFLLPLLEPAN